MPIEPRRAVWWSLIGRPGERLWRAASPRPRGAWDYGSHSEYADEVWPAQPRSRGSSTRSPQSRGRGDPAVGLLLRAQQRRVGKSGQLVANRAEGPILYSLCTTPCGVSFGKEEKTVQNR